DQAWLDALDGERQKRLLDKISYEGFEVVIDRLEKEWFNLAKLILKPELAFPSDDSCTICDELEGENNNAIVFCDGCNVAVHQGKIQLCPQGHEAPGSVSPGTQVSCILCPNSGGAFKTFPSNGGNSFVAIFTLQVVNFSET
ncbi:hypothetical protein B0H14DRAFT_2380935, partial [Mycena olivaceomarginata]